jgi:hypothetical protein
MEGAWLARRLPEALRMAARKSKDRELKTKEKHIANLFLYH